MPKGGKSSLIQFVGTPDYIAPEVLKGSSYSNAADWWAVGIMAYEFLTNMPPFNDKTVENVFYNIQHMKIDWLDSGRLVFN